MSEPLVIIGNGMAAARLADDLSSRALGRYAVAVVGEVWVAEVVAGVVTVTVVVVPVHAPLVELFELPHAAIASAKHGTRTIAGRLMVWGSLTTLGPPPRSPSRARGTIAGR